MGNGWYISIAHFRPVAAPKALQSHLTFTHSYTKGGDDNHASRQPARQERLGFSVLLRDTSTFGYEDPGIEPATLRSPDDRSTS